MGLDPGSQGSHPGLKAGAKPLSHQGCSPSLSFQKDFIYLLERVSVGIPGWLSGLQPSFGPGRDLGVPGSSPTSGSLHGACLSLSLCLS